MNSHTSRTILHRRTLLHLFLFSSLLIFFSITSSGQVKKQWTMVLNPTSMLINGNTVTASTMLTGNLFKAMGNPDRTDTLIEKQLETYNDYSMARMNKYFSKGVLLKQGKGTDRVNRIMVFLNPDPAKRYIDYLNTRYTGSLSILGLKIDSNTSIKKMQQFMARYDFSVSDAFEIADLTVYDSKNKDRQLEIKFFFSAKTQKIEYFEINYYPVRPAKRHQLEYKEGNLYLDNILLDSAANKATLLKKLLGSPNLVLQTPYRALNGQVYDAVYNYYEHIAGFSFLENPSNNSLLNVKLNYLHLRREHDLDNPLFQLLINKKPFDPENAVDRGKYEFKTRYAFDSISTNIIDKAGYVHAFCPNGRFSFEFASSYEFERKVYYVEYHLTALPRKTGPVAVQPPAKPGLYIRDGQVWMQQGSMKRNWNSSTTAQMVFWDIIGKPTGTSKVTVSTYPDYGMRMWANNDGTLNSIEYYMAEQINPISKKNDAPGIFSGVVEVEGHQLTTETTLSQVQEFFPQYNLKKAYIDENHHVIVGTYLGVKLYFTFLKQNTKLIAVSVYN